MITALTILNIAFRIKEIKVVKVVTSFMECMYWATNELWFRLNPETKMLELTDEAPERARKSFEMWRNNKRK